MSSGLPVRKRDRFQAFLQSMKELSFQRARELVGGTPHLSYSVPLGTSVNRSSSPSVASQPSAPPPLTTTPALQTSDPSQDFLQQALKQLANKDQLAIEKYVTHDISTSIQAAYDAAGEQQRACQNKRWPGSEKADKILRWLDKFKSVGDVIANVDPLHVGLPWAGIRMLLEAAMTDSRQMNALVSGMDLALCIANRLQAYLTYYQRLPNALLTTENFRKALIPLYTHVLRFLACAIQVYSMHTATQKLQALWQDSELTSFQTECDKLGSRAEIEANNCDRELHRQELAAATQWRQDLAATLLEIDSIESITKSIDVLQMKVDLSKLSVVKEATYNSSAEEKMSLCLQGTRSEILHNIRRWVDEPDGKFIFWLCGKAGTGKSTISRTIAQTLDKPQGNNEQRRLGASFFFKRGEQNRSNANLFFSTIAAQLADLIPQMRVPISVALDQDSLLCGRGLQEQFEKLLLQPLLNLDEAHMPQQRVVIVVDALDECDRSTDIALFLRLLAQVNAKSALRLRIFLTSRPELPIQLGFRRLDGSLHQDIALEVVQEGTIRRDIQAYLESEFTKIREDRYDDSLLKDWPSDADLQTLVDLAFPLFIFASTVCRFVSEMKPRARLQSILMQRYAAVPSHLAKTYLPILDSLLDDKVGAERNEIIQDFRKIVGPIVLAADPLSITSLASLLCSQPQNISEEINDILRHLHSVLEIPPHPSDPVRLLHLSFRDFLTDQEREDRAGFWIDKAGTHKDFVHYCLRRLNEALQSDICRVEQPGTKRLEVPAQQIKTHIPPDVAYACSHWPSHLFESGEELIDDSPVHNFLLEHFLHWLEALSWLGKLSNAITFISDLISIAQGNNSSRVSEFLQDAKRFVLRNRFVIDLAPLQTYHSALIFTPTQSIVRKIFYQMPQPWARLPDVPEKWSAEIQKLEGHANSVNAVVFSTDGQVIASASDDKTLRLWDVATGEQTYKLEGHKGAITAVAFSPVDQCVIASASWDRTVRLWNTGTGEQTHKLEGHKSWVNAVAFSPDGQFIASASGDKTVRLWNTGTGEQMHKLEGHEDRVKAVAFSPDGQVIASASDDKTVRLWHTATGEQAYKLEGHEDEVNAVGFSPDGQFIASASVNKTVRSWHTATGKQAYKLEGHEDEVNAVAFSPDGQIIASASDDGTVRAWNTATGEQMQKLVGHESGVTAVAFSPVDRCVIASASFDKTVRIWNTVIGEQMQKLEGHQDIVQVVVFSPADQCVIASASRDKTVRLWNTGTGEQTYKLEGHGNWVTAVAFSPDGQVIASASEDDRVRVWNTTTGEQMQKLEGHEDGVTAVVFSPVDQCVIASASRDKTVLVWNTVTGEQMQKLAGHQAAVQAVAFSPDGKVIASGSWDQTVRLWNVATGEHMQKLEGHENWVNAVAFSPVDRCVIASASYGKTVRVWSTITGDTIQLISDVDFVHHITFSTDGKSLHTNNGSFPLEDAVAALPRRASVRTAPLELKDQWLRIQGRDQLWLPHEYRGHCSAIHEKTLIIGQVSGAVSIFILK